MVGGGRQVSADAAAAATCAGIAAASVRLTFNKDAFSASSVWVMEKVSSPAAQMLLLSVQPGRGDYCRCRKDAVWKWGGWKQPPLWCCLFSRAVAEGGKTDWRAAGCRKSIKTVVLEQVNVSRLFQCHGCRRTCNHEECGLKIHIWPRCCWVLGPGQRKFLVRQMC